MLLEKCIFSVIYYFEIKDHVFEKKKILFHFLFKCINGILAEIIFITVISLNLLLF